jgi:integrase
MEVSAEPCCPQCGSNRLYRDGQRYLSDGQPIQRWLCRRCYYRFSISNFKDEKTRIIHQLGALARVKKLDSATELKTVAGDKKVDKESAKGILLQYALFLQKEGYGQDSRYPSFIRMLLNSECNVYNPETVKETIAKKKWKNGTKMLACYAYDALTKMLGLKWVMPTYRQEEYLFFLPDEAELDALINATRSQRMRCYLQTLKEIWPDPSEALRLRWIDIDANRNVIAINRPVKDHNPREIEVTSRLIAMISKLSRTSELIFPMKYVTMYATFKKLRKRVASNTQNPRILSIKPNSFRHWGGTQLAWLSNGNTLFVKEKLGLKKIENVLKYIGRIDWKLNQDFDVVTATTDEEIKKYGEAGYQKYDERTVGGTHVSYYRRPKRFGSLKA